MLENSKGLIRLLTLAKQRSNIEQTVLGGFYSARAISRHPRILSRIVKDHTALSNSCESRYL